MSKIPCTIGMLTLNVEDTLERCLASLKDFDEIIICDGNSTDRTVEIAYAHGIKIVKQYDWDEPNLRCVKDKSRVRQRNMDAARNDWYFFMDADDTLAPDVVEEIRDIVTTPDQEKLIWQMPSRIFIAGHEIKHEAAYPAYQIRLINRNSDARFKGRVHDHIVYDKSRFALGTMNHFYDFHWSRERMQEYWQYLKTYAEWEVEVAEPATFGSFIYWRVYRKLRTIAGYMYRIPRMYVRHGMRDTMPLGIEMKIVLHHMYVLFLAVKKQFTESVSVTLIIEVLRGKDMTRTLSNIALLAYELEGHTLDIGGAAIPSSYFRFFGIADNYWLTTLNIRGEVQPDIILNIEHEKVPRDDRTYDRVLAFNILEHLNTPQHLLQETMRVLRPDGLFIGCVPFLVGVHPDPYDFQRYTDQRLERMFVDAGFRSAEIIPIGRGPFLAAFAQVEFLLPSIAKLPIMPFVFLMDMILHVLRPSGNFRARYPLAYIFVTKK